MKKIRFVFSALIILSMFLSLLAAPFSGSLNVNAQTSDELTQGWDLEVAMPPNLIDDVPAMVAGMAADGVDALLEGDILKASGTGGAEQLRRVLYESIGHGFNLISNRTDLSISLPMQESQQFTLKLESNITTGYGWELTGSEGVEVVQDGDVTSLTRGDERQVGAPQMVTFTYKPSAAGISTLNFAYLRPFGEPEEARTRINLRLAENTSEVDLSDPSPELPVFPEEDLNGLEFGLPDMPMGTLPTSFDWRTQGIVPPIRDQKNCGSCWAFAATGAFESAVKKGGGPLSDFSEQFLVSCNKDGYNCSYGGFGSIALKYYVNTTATNQTAVGAVYETDKPYTDNNGTCTTALTHPYKGYKYGFVASSLFTIPTVTQLKNAIYTYGPITAAVCAGYYFSYYDGGIFSDDESWRCNYGNHEVVLVGWDDATETWILRNSWGTSWGEDGYMRIKWGTSRIGIEAAYVAADIPATPTTVSPSGDIDINKPTFIWSRISNATSYQLTVYNNTTAQEVYSTTVSSSACSSTTGQCKYTPSTALVYNNSYKWKVLARNSGGSSEYSPTVNFSPIAETPAAPVLRTPTGVINDIKPAYVWSRINIATTYKLVVTDVVGAKNLIDMSVSSSYCSTSTNLCTYTPSTSLAQYKDYQWKVMATSAKGVSSPYSSPLSIRSILAVPVAQTPLDTIATIKPAYVWSRVLNATTYKLTVYDIVGETNVIDSNVSSSACSSTTNKCTYTPSTALGPNRNYRWKVVASNSSGSSLESNTLTFRPVPPVAPITESPTGNIFTTKPAYIWSRIENATSYNLVVNDGVAIKDLINLSVSSSYCSTSTNKCTYTPSTALTLYKDYQWKVLASNAAGSSPFTGNVNIRSILAVPVPSTPTGNIGVLKPSYVWSRVLGATTYRLTVYDISGETNVVEMNVSSSSCSSTTNKCTYTPAFVLTPNKNYRWKVYAGSIYGNSAESSPVSFRPVPPVAPAAETPTGNITTTKPVYVWTRVDNTTTYNLLVVDVAAAKNVINLSVSSSNCSTTTNKCTYTPSTSLSLYKDYQWKVLASNAVGSSSFSGTLSFKPILPTPVTYTPTGDIGTLNPAYVWSRISAATSYMLTVNDIAGETNLIYQNVGSTFCSSTTNKCTYTPSTALTLNKNYRWKVYALNILGVSAETGFVNFKPIPPAIPVTDSPVGDITTLKPTYIWSRISDANTYKLVVRDVSGEFNLIDISVSKSYCSTTTNLCKYTPSTYLSLNKTYQWKVMAVNAAGLSSAFSSAVNFKPVLPPAPTTIAPTGNITITKPPYVWSRVSTATSYKLYVIDVLAGKTILTATVSSSYCTTEPSRCTYTPSTTLTRNKDYQWKVEAISAGGLSSLPSGLVNFRVTY